MIMNFTDEQRISAWQNGITIGLKHHVTIEMNAMELVTKMGGRASYTGPVYRAIVALSNWRLARDS